MTRADDELDPLVPEHVRHRPPIALPEPRPCWVACPQFKSQVNLSRLVRLVSCCGINRIITSGNPRIDATIARDGADFVAIEKRRSLVPRLKELKAEGWQLVGLEQTSRSQSLYHYPFPRRMVLVIGHERNGIDAETLSILDAAVEIPVYGMPYSYNVVTAASMALYEYCRQYPQG